MPFCLPFYRIPNFLSFLYHFISSSLLFSSLALPSLPFSYLFSPILSSFFFPCTTFSFLLSLLLSFLTFSLINCSLSVAQIWAVISSKLLDDMGLKRSLPSHSIAPCCKHQDEVMNASTCISILFQSLLPSPTSSSSSPSHYSIDSYLSLVCSGDTM